MREHGRDQDAWPDLYQKVKAADILVLTTPIWLGEKSSVCTRLIERLYANSADTNDAGQSAYYGRTGRGPFSPRARLSILRSDHPIPQI